MRRTFEALRLIAKQKSNHTSDTENDEFDVIKI
jgi:hypothetical protein